MTEEFWITQYSLLAIFGLIAGKTGIVGSIVGTIILYGMLK